MKDETAEEKNSNSMFLCKPQNHNIDKKNHIRISTVWYIYIKLKIMPTLFKYGNDERQDSGEGLPGVENVTTKASGSLLDLSHVCHGLTQVMSTWEQTYYCSYTYIYMCIYMASI